MKKIIIENLNKYYNRGFKNELHVINNTSLEFDDHGLVCLLGESGSGKTTLLNVMSGIDKAQSGKIIVDGELIKCNDAKSDPIKNNKFGYVFQNYYMINADSVYDNLYLAMAPYHLSKKEVDERIDYVLEAVDMSRYKKRKVNQLSGGQAQRVAIARALIKSPDVIFADEPTGNLDEATTLRIMTILKNISKKCLVIVATHERRIADFFADRIIKISDGKVIDDYLLENNDKVYDVVDDHNLYLEEFDRTQLNSEKHNVNIYTNDLDDHLNLEVIVEKGKIYINSDDSNKYELIDNKTNIKAIHSSRPVMDTQAIKSFKYELDRPSKVNNGLLSFKELIKKVTTSVRSKSFFIMILALILISGLSIMAVGDYQTISNDKVEETYTTDNRTIKVALTQNTNLGLLDYRKAVGEVVDIFKTKCPDMEIDLSFKPYAYILYTGIQQIESTVSNTTTVFNGFSYMPIEYLDESTITLGRMPEDMYEVVVDEWVLDKFMKEENIVAVSMKKYENFVGKKIYLQNSDTTLTIVGVCHSENMSLYMDNYGITNLSSSFYEIASLSYFKSKTTGYENIELAEDEIMVDKDYIRITYTETAVNGIQFKVIPTRYNDEIPMPIVMSDASYNRFIEGIVQISGEFRIITNDKAKIKEMLDEFNNEENTEFADYREILVLKYYDAYETARNNYYYELNQKIRTRSIVTLMIFVMCLATLFITMKAHATENMQTTMVYRLLGLKKVVVTLIYAIEILIISFAVMIPTSLAVVGVLKFLEAIPASTYHFELTIGAYFATLGVMFILNVIIGIIPILFIMRKSPAQLVSEYDL